MWERLKNRDRTLLHRLAMERSDQIKSEWEVRGMIERARRLMDDADRDYP